MSKRKACGKTDYVPLDELTTSLIAWVDGVDAAPKTRTTTPTILIVGTRLDLTGIVDDVQPRSPYVLTVQGMIRF